MADDLHGKRRARLTVVALALTILCGAATLFGNLRGVIIYPTNLEASIGKVHQEAEAADKRAAAVAADVLAKHIEQITRDSAQEARIKALEDDRAELKGVLNLLVYRANESKASMDKLNEKIDAEIRNSNRVVHP